MIEYDNFQIDVIKWHMFNCHIFRPKHQKDFVIHFWSNSLISYFFFFFNVSTQISVLFFTKFRHPLCVLQVIWFLFLWHVIKNSKSMKVSLCSKFQCFQSFNVLSAVKAVLSAIGVIVPFFGYAVFSAIPWGSYREVSFIWYRLNKFVQLTHRDWIITISLMIEGMGSNAQNLMQKKTHNIYSTSVWQKKYICPISLYFSGP